MQSCINGRWLRDREYILADNKIKGVESVSKDEMKILLKQVPNRRIPDFRVGKYSVSATPFLWFYLFGREFYYENNIQAKIDKKELKYNALKNEYFADSLKNYSHKDSLLFEKKTKKLSKKIKKLHNVLKEGNWVMRVMGEKPAYLDTMALRESKEQLEIYLKSKGYLKSSVQIKLDTLGNDVIANYLIKEGKPSKVGKLIFQIPDSMLSVFVHKHLNNSFLKEGNIYEEQNLSNERERITKLLRDNGYYDFARQYINYLVDTTNIDKIGLTLQINNPSDENKHRRYVINKVVYHIDDLGKKAEPIYSQEYNSVNYNYYIKKYPVKILNGKNELFPYQFYSFSNAQKTQQNLTSLDVFKFVRVSFEKTDTSINSLTAYVQAQSLPKYQLSDEWGFTVGQGQGYPGPMANLSLSNRNLFRNAEILSFNLRAAVEGQPSVLDLNKFYRTFDYGGNVSLTYPQLIMPSNLRFKLDKYQPKTRFTFSYQNVVRPEYTRAIYKGTYNYILNVNTFEKFIFSPFDISVLNTSKKSSDFEERLSLLSKQGNFLINSFSKSIVTAMAANYIFNNNDPYANNRSYQLKLSAEMGGMLFHLMNYFGVLNKNTVFEGNELLGLNYYKYLKFNLDYRKYIPTSKTGSIAARVNVGTSLRYGGATSLPYEKFFFAGGSNSVRAWSPRRLGIGSVGNIDTTTGQISYSTEMPGEILIEGSLERRFKIFKFIDGALFVDAGNVWTYQKQKDTDFKWTEFYNQIALGAGYGLRFNFTYVIVRFDFGYKIYDPVRSSGERWRLNKIGVKHPFGEANQFVSQIGIGYPF